jgi:hypothetical protein
MGKGSKYTDGRFISQAAARKLGLPRVDYVETLDGVCVEEIDEIMAGDKLKITCNSFPSTNNSEMAPKQSDYFLKASAGQNLDGKSRTANRALTNGFSNSCNRRMFGKGGAFSDPAVEEGLQKVGQNLIDIIDSDGGSGGDANSLENFQAQDDMEAEENAMGFARNMGFYESRMNKHNHNNSNDSSFQTKQQAPGGPQRSMPFSPSAPAQLPQPHGPSSIRTGANSPRSVSTFSMTTLLSTSSGSKSQVGSPVTAESIRAKRQEHAQALIQQHQVAAARVAANGQSGSPGAGDAHHHAQPARRSHEQARFSPLVQVLRDHMVSPSFQLVFA